HVRCFSEIVSRVTKKDQISTRIGRSSRQQTLASLACGFGNACGRFGSIPAHGSMLHAEIRAKLSHLARFFGRLRTETMVNGDRKDVGLEIRLLVQEVTKEKEERERVTASGNSHHDTGPACKIDGGKISLQVRGAV